jgi:hypothetical protein
MLRPRDVSQVTSPPLFKALKFNMLMTPKNANTDLPLLGFSIEFLLAAKYDGDKI